jgi:hypothetical protein
MAIALKLRSFQAVYTLVFLLLTPVAEGDICSYNVATLALW